MYIALKPMPVRMPDLTVAKLNPGDEVPGFASWTTWTQKAMLDGQMVRWAIDGKLTPHEEVAASRNVVQPMPAGPLGKPVEFEARARQPELYVPAEPNQPNAAASQSLVVDSEAEARPLEYEPVDEAASTLVPVRAAGLGGMDAKVQVTTPGAAGTLHCATCGKSGFKDKSGLRIHQARVHKDQG